MDKFITKELTIEIVEDVPAHNVVYVLINGEKTLVGYNLLSFIKGYAKEEDQ